MYHQMPERYRKHGDMPTQVEIQDDVDAFFQENRYCRECQLTHRAGTREATRDFVYADLCIKHHSI